MCSENPPTEMVAYGIGTEIVGVKVHPGKLKELLQYGYTLKPYYYFGSVVESILTG